MNQVIGILAHVDAGKTTLSEALLYTTGKIKKLGRVDWRNTYLDTHELERERGITIFSKQARLSYGTDPDKTMDITLLDTPGHVDFSAETERVLSVLDYAILVISGSEGVQAHTETLWHLLERYAVPTFVFVTKMDLTGADESAVMADLRAHLDTACVDFSDEGERDEHIAMCDEDLLEAYMETGEVDDGSTARLIASRKLFPVFFGSGLRLDGIQSFLDALGRLTVEKSYREDFAARVYKIAHDPQGGRLTYLKITGGSLNVRQTLTYQAGDDERSEKVNQIRLYSGAKFDTAETVKAGEVCCVTGLSGTYAGQGLGSEQSVGSPCLEPVLNYRIRLPKDVDPQIMLTKLRELEEEEPLLHVVWNERFSEIHAQVMGEVQTEVLVSLISERYGVDVEFDEGRILYRETVTASAEGVGHFEPLRHYAEVHVMLEPLERGAGLVFDTVCSENFLDRNWQRLILTHLEEKQHLGVLTGSPITDMKITLVTGRAHLKHTVGGDFRESTYRAVRQGLMQLREEGKCVLLEPYYTFRLELPGECVGRAISDILARFGTFDEHEAEIGTSVLTGRAPVSAIGDYAREVAAYTHGKGRFSCRVEGYFPCHNPDEVMEQFGYNPESDMDNTPDSVFCSHGAGVIVPWNAVHQYQHLESMKIRNDDVLDLLEVPPEPAVIQRNLNIDEKELEAIMEREFGPIRRKIYGEVKQAVTTDGRAIKHKKSLYIVDGYNVIFAWDELAELAEIDLEGARNQLLDVLANYQAYTKRDMIVVFDAYNVKGAVERKFDYHGLHVVYTKEGELGDTYIERLTYEIGRDHSVRVVTSDGMIQLQAVKSGVLRLSAREFHDEVISVNREIGEILKKLQKNPK